MVFTVSVNDLSSCLTSDPDPVILRIRCENVNQVYVRRLGLAVGRLEENDWIREVHISSMSRLQFSSGTFSLSAELGKVLAKCRIKRLKIHLNQHTISLLDYVVPVTSACLCAVPHGTDELDALFHTLERSPYKSNLELQVDAGSMIFPSVVERNSLLRFFSRGTGTIQGCLTLGFSEAENPQNALCILENLVKNSQLSGLSVTFPGDHVPFQCGRFPPIWLDDFTTALASNSTLTKLDLPRMGSLSFVQAVFHTLIHQVDGTMKNKRLQTLNLHYVPRVSANAMFEFIPHLARLRHLEFEYALVDNLEISVRFRDALVADWQLRMELALKRNTCLESMKVLFSAEIETRPTAEEPDLVVFSMDGLGNHSRYAAFDFVHRLRFPRIESYLLRNKLLNRARDFNRSLDEHPVWETSATKEDKRRVEHAIWGRAILALATLRNYGVTGCAMFTLFQNNAALVP